MVANQIKSIHWQCFTHSPTINQQALIQSSWRLHRRSTTHRWWQQHIWKRSSAIWARTRAIKDIFVSTAASFTRGSTAWRFTYERTPDLSHWSVDIVFVHSVIRRISTSMWSFMRIIRTPRRRRRRVWAFNSTARRRVRVIEEAKVSCTFSFFYLTK